MMEAWAKWCMGQVGEITDLAAERAKGDALSPLQNGFKRAFPKIPTTPDDRAPAGLPDPLQTPAVESQRHEAKRSPRGHFPSPP
jgi:hypothetical protein